MTAINGYQNTSVGRMFARQAATTVYNAGKAAGLTADEAQATDNVSWSKSVPTPLPADLVKNALKTARELEEGSTSKTSAKELRENRLFAMVSALALLGGSEDPTSVDWPGGLPNPTRQELEIARRRLAQRPEGMESVADPEELTRSRLEILRKLGKSDFSDTSFAVA